MSRLPPPPGSSRGLGICRMPRTRFFVRAVIAFENDLVVGEIVVAKLVFALDACVEKNCWHLDLTC